MILCTCLPSNPKELWEKYNDFMTDEVMNDDILHQLRSRCLNLDIQFTPEIYNEALLQGERCFDINELNVFCTIK
jgi:hypothetical protein